MFVTGLLIGFVAGMYVGAVLLAWEIQKNGLPDRKTREL